tara:strand:+ start:3459 stop:3698 length:240 start_codon:yes stop_codon:yes gene_type:complete
VKTSLLKGLTKEEVSDVRGTFKSSVLLRKQLTLMLQGEIESLQDKMLLDEDFNTSEWKLKHVSMLAQIKANKKLISYLE